MRRRLVVAAVFITAATIVTTSGPAGAATTPPILNSPTSGSTNAGTVAISYVLPQAPLSGSVSVIFIGPTTCTWTMTGSQAVSFAYDPTTDPALLLNVSVSTCSSIPNGTYTVVLAYQNSAADPAATATASSVVLSAAMPTTTTSTTSTTTSTSLNSSTTVPPASPITAPVAATRSGRSGAGIAFTG